jgi:predicted RNase H-like nuclease (RuvC/YqgF family)
MQDSFELLEERIRKAADLVQHLRTENVRLGDDLEKARKKATDAEKRLQAAEKQGGTADPQMAKRVEDLDQEVGVLRHEREEIRRRIEKLVKVLEDLD